MANPVKISLTVKGRSFKKTQEAFNKAVQRSLRDIGKNFAKNAKLNASIDKGPLRASIKSEVFPALDKVVISASVAYAFKVHEFHLPAQSSPSFNRGVRTAAQPIPAEGDVGGKFFERVSNYRARQYFNYSAEVITASLEQRAVRVKLT